MKFFNTPGIKLMKRALHVYSKQHEALAENVANANNPNFKRKKTDFSNTLSDITKRTLKISSGRHIRQSDLPETIPVNNKNGKNEIIDMTKEMGDLAVNQIKFDFGARILRRAYNGMSSSITGRFR